MDYKIWQYRQTPSSPPPSLPHEKKDNFFKTKDYDSYREKSVIDIILQYLTKPV